MLPLKSKYIPSGNYYVSKGRPIILKAVLGTCLGVAICDPKNNVGAMIHLLLAKSSAVNMEENPARYAASGIPLLISALTACGAEKKNMVATVAGGALVGPVNRTDLQLNIGGQTSDVAYRILHEHHIAVSTSETGGDFSCCLCLDMSCLETYIEPVAQHAEQLPEKPVHPDQREIMMSMENLRPIPQVALKIMKLIDREDVTLQKIAKEVSQDQVLSAQTLKLCNSAVFAKSSRIESIDSALIFLGKKLFFELVILAAVNSYYNRSDQGYSICKGGLYHHAVGCAIISEKLARFTGKAKPTMAYTAGLLHDIGKVVLDQHIHNVYPFMYRDVASANQKQDIRDIENELIGIDHAKAGGLLASAWKMPDFLVDTIRNHHQPWEASVEPMVTNLVCIADFLMSRFQSGLELESISSTILFKSMEQLDVPASQLSALIDLIPYHVFAAPYL